MSLISFSVKSMCWRLWNWNLLFDIPHSLALFVSQILHYAAAYLKLSPPSKHRGNNSASLRRFSFYLLNVRRSINYILNIPFVRLSFRKVSRIRSLTAERSVQRFSRAVIALACFYFAIVSWIRNDIHYEYSISANYSCNFYNTFVLLPPF